MLTECWMENDTVGNNRIRTGKINVIMIASKGSASLRGVKETIDHKLAGRTQIDEWFSIDKTCIPLSLCAHIGCWRKQLLASFVFRFCVAIKSRQIYWELKWALSSYSNMAFHSFLFIFLISDEQQTHRDEEMISKNLFLILTSRQYIQLNKQEMFSIFRIWNW